MKNLSHLLEYFERRDLFLLGSKSANEICNLMEEFAYVRLRIHIGS